MKLTKKRAIPKCEDLAVCKGLWRKRHGADGLAGAPRDEGRHDAVGGSGDCGNYNTRWQHGAAPE